MSPSEDYICNVLIMGRTGAGKSSLLNYLCNKKIADTGTGKPVTGEGIYKYDVTINKQKVRLFDSWGIEPGKTERWNNILKEELKKHGVQKKIADWFHCIIYCIQAGRGRVENIDLDIIQHFLRDKYHLTIILTKADQIKEDTRDNLKKIILKDILSTVKTKKQGLLKVVATCAEQKKIRRGEIKPFGKEEAIDSIFDSWKETIIDRIPKHIIGQIYESVDNWAQKQKNYIPLNRISGKKSSNKDLYQQLIDYAKEKVDNIQEYELPELLQDSLNSCKKTTKSIERIFNHGIYIFDDNILKNVETDILNTRKKWYDYLIINSKKNIAAQEGELCAFVDKLAEEIKLKVKTKEKQITIIFEDLLQDRRINANYVT